MARSLTVVLPVHNAEATLPRQVEELLTIAGELTSQFELLVIDDGSIDDTYEIASELATRFPQIRVKRHADHRGLGPTLRGLRGRVKTDVVIVHDGVSPLDGEQVRRLWFESLGQQLRLDRQVNMSPRHARLQDLRAPLAMHRAMAVAHRRLGGFELLPSEALLGDESHVASFSPTFNSHRPRGGVGRIPLLPAPNLYSTVADFALGE